jgi:hypothetical protein
VRPPFCLQQFCHCVVLMVPAVAVPLRGRKASQAALGGGPMQMSCMSSVRRRPA